MERDLQIYKLVVTPLIQAIETYTDIGICNNARWSSYAEYLNNIGVHSPSGKHWTEHSLKMFCARTLRKYGHEFTKNYCGADFTDGYTNPAWCDLKGRKPRWKRDYDCEDDEFSDDGANVTEH